ncbi:54S ribosomal protein L31, partial [Colletotrichum orchidophilum]
DEATKFRESRRPRPVSKEDNQGTSNKIHPNSRYRIETERSATLTTDGAAQFRRRLPLNSHLDKYIHIHAHTMFGAFRMTSPLSGGLLWKIPWRLSKFQKRRHRERLRAVDDVIATVDAALTKKGETVAALERWKAEMPTEAEMLPRDKYTMFDRKEKKYRKGIHKLPKWTRVSQRLNPPGY